MRPPTAPDRSSLQPVVERQRLAGGRERRRGRSGGRPLTCTPDSRSTVSRLDTRSARDRGPRRHHDRRPPRVRRRAPASSVSSVWLIVPRPVRAATTTGRPRSTARSRTRVARRERHEQPADALADERVASSAAASARAATSRRARSPRRPARRRSAATAAGRTCREPRRPGACPALAAPASSSWSRGHSPGRLVEAGDDRLEGGDPLAAAPPARRRSPRRRPSCRRRCRCR